MFNEYVILHTPPNVSEAQTNKNISQVEKTTQAGDGNIWKVNTMKRRKKKDEEKKPHTRITYSFHTIYLYININI